MNVLKRNNVTVIGEGKQSILFANGYGCDQNVWRHVTPEFKKDYKIVLFDYVGTGKSDLSAYQTNRYNSLYGYAQDAIDICEALNLSEVIIVGHSVGAMVAALAHIQAPQYFSSLVLIGPSPSYINEGNYTGGFERSDIDELMEMLNENYVGWSSNMAPAIMGNPDRPELGQELTASFCSMPPEIAKKFGKVTFLSDLRKEMMAIKIPTAILQCSEDIIVPEIVGHYLNEQIQNSQLFTLQATGHCPNLSAPAEITKVIKQFIAKVANS